jgi:hypothetical protein
VKLAPLLVACSITLIACADPPEPIDEGPQNGQPEAAPDVAEIVCESDGSTTVLTPQVLAQPDGVHVHILSHLDEPAEIIDLGHDVDPGETQWVSHAPPGTIETACNPFSHHDSGEAPPTTPVEILDPDGLYLDGELECGFLGTVWSMTGDFAEAPREGLVAPLDDARAAIGGLGNSDEVRYAGYPSSGDRQVVVVRDGSVVASFDLVTFDGERWIAAGATGCSGTGIEAGHG